MTRFRKWIIAIIPVLLLVGMVFWLKERELVAKQDQLRQEIAVIEHQTAEIQPTLVELKKSANKVLQFSGRIFASDHAEVWCANLMKEIYIEHDLNVDFKVKGLKIPYGMDTPWSFRQIGTSIYPGLAPCQVKVTFEGSLFKIELFLRESQQSCRSMIISCLDLSLDEQGDHYLGTATFVFPQILCTEDFIQIRQFAQEI